MFGRKYAKYRTKPKTKASKYVKKRASLSKKVAKLSRAVRANQPELKWYRTGSNLSLPFGEMSGGLDGAPLCTSLKLPIKGPNAEDRIGDSINVKKIELGVDIRGAGLIKDIDYKIVVFLFKDKFSGPTWSLTDLNKLYEPDLFSAASNGNAITPRSFLHPDYRKTFKVIRVIKGRATIPNPMLTGSPEWSKEHTFVIRKPFKIRFENFRNSGQAADATYNSIHILFMAGNASDANYANQCLTAYRLNTKMHYTDA